MNQSLSFRLHVLALVAIVFGVLAAPFALLAYGEDLKGGPVLVVAAPWSDLDAMVADAGGRVIGPEQAPMARLVATERDIRFFRAELRRAGAWAVFNSANLARICGYDA